MPAVPVQISLDADLLRRIDSDPKVQAKGRSAFVREALEAYLRVRRRTQIDDRIRAAYRGKGEGMLDEIEGLIGSQAWPDE